MAMRTLLLSTLLLISSESFLAAQEVIPLGDAKKKVELTAEQQEFLNLPEQKREDFYKHFDEATRLFNQKRIFQDKDSLQKTF